MSAQQTGSDPVVSVIMGSQSDWPTLCEAVALLEALQIPHEKRIVSAHRTPQRMYEFATGAQARGIRVIIAGAGGSAHLPGMVAALTLLPVIAVPVSSKALSGMDSLLSIVQMPRGVAVATQAIGPGGAANAGLMAAQILALGDADLSARLARYREQITAGVAEAVDDTIGGDRR